MNGTLRHHPHVATPAEPQGALKLADGDPFFRMLAFGIVGACLFHAAFAIRIAYIHAELISWAETSLSSFVEARMDRTIMIEPETVPDKLPEPPPDPVKDDTPPPPVATTDTPPPQAPPAAAQAAAIIAAAPDPNDPLDLTGTFVTGTADHYAGGTTQQSGTSTVAVRATGVAATGQPGGTGTGTAPPSSVDRSRAVQRAGTGDWKCPFPPEADLEQIDDASAIVAVTIGVDGRVQSATIDQDPGHGFGREARSCALRESYSAALDRDGKAIVGTKKFRVLFTR
ncbi:hypothetical protein BH09MYX1_BH09MYX1_17720 [soil metagenome]